MDLRFGFSTEAIQNQPVSCIVMSKRNIWQKLCSRCRSQVFPVWSHEESVERCWLSPSDIWAGRKWQLRMMFSKQLRMLRFWEPQRPWKDQSLRKEILEHFNGISVKNYSLKRDEKEFLTFLIILGCPPSSTILTSILKREQKVQVVVVEELSSTDVLTLYKSIHFPQTNRKFFDVPLYCKVVRNINLHQWRKRW